MLIGSSVFQKFFVLAEVLLVYNATSSFRALVGSSVH
jgi:hypothetical protein